MREIKFRGYSERIGMFNIDVLAIAECSWSCGSGKMGVSIPYQPSIKVMQFTGLLDKNGVEIYEGDILQRDSYWGGKKIGEEFVTVIFKKAQFMFLWNKDKTETYLGNLLNGFFVVGNIHQNPELLK